MGKFCFTLIDSQFFTVVVGSETLVDSTFIARPGGRRRFFGWAKQILYDLGASYSFFVLCEGVKY